MEERPIVTVDCAYCGEVNYYRKNEIDYVYHMCHSCGRCFFIRPKRKDMEAKIGHKPNAKHLLTKDEIKIMIDIALDIRDFDMVKEYKQLLDCMEDDDVLIFDLQSGIVQKA